MRCSSKNTLQLVDALSIQSDSTVHLQCRPVVFADFIDYSFNGQCCEDTSRSLFESMNLYTITTIYLTACKHAVHRSRDAQHQDVEYI